MQEVRGLPLNSGLLKKTILTLFFRGRGMVDFVKFLTKLLLTKNYKNIPRTANYLNPQEWSFMPVIR